jgi:hypothetical protein
MLHARILYIMSDGALMSTPTSNPDAAAYAAATYAAPKYATVVEVVAAAPPVVRSTTVAM